MSVLFHNSDQLSELSKLTIFLWNPNKVNHAVCGLLEAADTVATQ